MFAFFMQLLLTVVVSELQAALQKDPDPMDVGTVEVPTMTEDRPAQYGAGVFEVVGNIVWHGDAEYKGVYEKVKKSWFSSTHVNVGYEYSMGLWMTLVGVPCDAITEVWYGDDLAWSGEHLLTEGMSELAVDFISSEEKVRDGLVGKFRFFNRSLEEGDRSANALVNGYVAAQVKEAVPEYPNMLHVVWLGPSGGNGMGFYGSSAQAKTIKFTVKRLPRVAVAAPRGRVLSYPVEGNLSDAPVKTAFDAWLAQVSDIEGDANPALLMLELLTSREPSISPSLSPYLIDIESFFRAADVLKAEGVGISPSWVSTASSEERSLGLCKVMHGGYRQDPVTQRISLKLARSTDAPVATFGSSNIVRWERFSRKAIEGATNTLEVPFRDRENRWAERVAIAKNPAGVKAAGVPVIERVEFPGVTRAALAQLLASRELRTRVSSLAEVAFEGIVEPGTTILPGDVIDVHHEPLGQRLRIRVTSARAASLGDPQRIAVEGVEDFFRPGFANNATVSPVPPVVLPEAPATRFRSGHLMLAPYGLSKESVDAPLYYVLAGANPTLDDEWRVAAQTEAPWESLGDVTYADSHHLPCVAGTVVSALDATQRDAVSVQLTESHAQYLSSVLARGAALHVLIGEELLYGTFYNADASTHIAYVQLLARGAYDTQPMPVAAGTEAVLLTDYAIYPEALQTDSGIGEKALTLRAELESKTWGETEASYRYVPYQSMSRADRPYAPAVIQMGTGVRPGHTPETANGTWHRVAAITVSAYFRDKAAPGVTGYTDTVQQRCGLKLCVRVGWQLDNGTWADNDAVRSAVDIEIVSVSTTNVPSGARLGRLRVWAENSNGVASKERVLYFKYAA